ncbi:MAG: sulfatase-like hydrolase/transferase [Rikenellaceae bacterium]
MRVRTLTIGAIAVAATATRVAAAESTETRPNIIFILTDDQRYDYLGCTGNPIVETPNIDKLAAEGVLFHNAHVSSAISTPSRTCILTGQFERSHGVNFNSGTALSREAWEDCYPMVLRRGGYYTGYIGKNHTPIGEKSYETGIIDNSFDYWYASHDHILFYPKNRHPIYKGAKNDTQVEILEEGVQDFLNPNERNLEGAVHFLDSRPTDKPFFLNVCFNLPHAASTSTMRQLDSDPELYKSKYRDIDIPLPKNYVAKADIVAPKLPADVLQVENRQVGYNYVDTPELLKERVIREYQAVTGIDKLVGKLVAELKKQGLDKNTIIIFASDHGIFKGEYGLGGKALCYEICTKIPMIVYDPRAPKSQRGVDNDELVLTIDISKSILDYAGLEAPKTYQGESLIPMLNGEKESVRDYLFTENLWSTSFGNPYCESVQNKEWKYIRYYKNTNQSSLHQQEVIKEMGLAANGVYVVDKTYRSLFDYRRYANSRLNTGEEPVYEELYNIKDDPYEAVNLITNNYNASLLEKMREECDNQLRYARGTGAPRVNVITLDYTPAPTPKKK